MIHWGLQMSKALQFCPWEAFPALPGLPLCSCAAPLLYSSPLSCSPFSPCFFVPLSSFPQCEYSTGNLWWYTWCKTIYTTYFGRVFCFTINLSLVDNFETIFMWIFKIFLLAIWEPCRWRETDSSHLLIHSPNSLTQERLTQTVGKAPCRG